MSIEPHYDTSATMTAAYFDGVCAKRRRVTLELGDEELRIRTAAGDAVVWPYHRVQRNDSILDGLMRLSVVDTSDAYLELDDERGEALVLARIPLLYRKPMQPMTSGALAARLALAVGTVAAALFGMRHIGRPIAYLLPASVEHLYGADVRDSLIGDAAVVTDPGAMAAINGLTKRLAQNDGIAYQVTLVDASIRNAVAAPGGYIVMYCPLVRDLASPDEFSGILAHEMSHVRLRHGTEQLVGAAAIATVVQTFLGDFSGISTAVASVAPKLLGLRYSRQTEAEADAMAAQRLQSAGLRANGIGEFFAREQINAGESKLENFLSTHPTNEERAHALQTSGKTGAPAFDDATWARVRASCH